MVVQAQAELQAAHGDPQGQAVAGVQGDAHNQAGDP